METEVNVSKSVSKTSKSVIIAGILAIILGVVAILYPSTIGKISTVVIGTFLVIGGVFRLAFAIVSFSLGSLLLKYLYAGLMIAAGIWIIMNPNMGLEVLTMVVAIYFIIDGITDIALSFSFVPIGGGMYMLLAGIISGVIGGIILSKWPESSNYFLGIYIGVKLIVDGLMLSAMGSAVHKTAKSI